MMFKKIFTVLLLVAATTSASAQKNFYDDFKPTNKWAVGIDIGPTFLNGDVNYNNLLGNAFNGFAFGAKAKYMFSNTFGLQGNFNLGSLNAESTGTRTFNSTNNFFALQMLPTFTLGNISWSRKMQPIHVNLFTGLGVIKNDIDATIDFNINGGAQNPDGTYNYTNTSSDFTLPLGAELRYRLSKKIDATLSYSVNFTNSDHLDGYPSSENERIESYTTIFAGVMFKLGKDEQHMEWVAPVEKTLEQVDKNSEMITKLTADKDEDGVSDFFDQDSETKEGALVYGNGVEVDSDRDGIADSDDAEPFSEKGSTVDENGKMIDNDADGIPDYRDADPNTPKGVLVDAQGNTYEIKMHDHCEDVTLPSLMFNNGSSKLDAATMVALYHVADKMKECPDLRVKVSGYAGGSKSAEQLNWKRVNSVIDYLNINYGVSRDRFIADTEAETDNKKNANRRVDLSKAGSFETGSSNPTPPQPGF